MRRQVHNLTKGQQELRTMRHANAAMTRRIAELQRQLTEMHAQLNVRRGITGAGGGGGGGGGVALEEAAQFAMPEQHHPSRHPSPSLGPPPGLASGGQASPFMDDWSHHPAMRAAGHDIVPRG